MVVSNGTPNKTSLTATKVQDLKNLCTQHGLPVTGHKADIVNRLLDFYKSPSSTPQKSQPISTNSHNNNNNNNNQPSFLTTTTHAQSSSNDSSSLPKSNPSLSAESITKNPKVPSEQHQISPSIQKTQPESTKNYKKADQISKAAPAVAATTTVTTAKTENTEPLPKKDGEAEESIESEILKRQQRAERFGIAVSKEKEEEQIKILNRIKKFGIVEKSNHDKLDKPLGGGEKSLSNNTKDGKSTGGSSNGNGVVDQEWEEKKRKRAEKFGLVDNQPASKSIKS